MFRTGFLVVLTVLCLVSGHDLTVNSVRSILTKAGLPDFKSKETDVFHETLIEILRPNRDQRRALTDILDKHGERLKGLLVNNTVSVKSETHTFLTVNTLIRQYAHCSGSSHTAKPPGCHFLKENSTV